VPVAIERLEYLFASRTVNRTIRERFALDDVDRAACVLRSIEHRGGLVLKRQRLDVINLGIEAIPSIRGTDISAGAAAPTLKNVLSLCQRWRLVDTAEVMWGSGRLCRRSRLQPGAHECARLAARRTPTDDTVLITGESGVGKTRMGSIGNVAVGVSFGEDRRLAALMGHC
jgi:hypothetical protein